MHKTIVCRYDVTSTCIKTIVCRYDVTETQPARISCVLVANQNWDSDSSWWAFKCGHRSNLSGSEIFSFTKRANSCQEHFLVLDLVLTKFSLQTRIRSCRNSPKFAAKPWITFQWHWGCSPKYLLQLCQKCSIFKVSNFPTWVFHSHEILLISITCFPFWSNRFHRIARGNVSVILKSKAVAVQRGDLQQNLDWFVTPWWTARQVWKQHF